MSPGDGGIGGASPEGSSVANSAMNFSKPASSPEKVAQIPRSHFRAAAEKIPHMSTPDKSASDCTIRLNSIAWNELITPDPAAAVKFYGDLFGWTTEPFGTGANPYTLFKHGNQTFGGVMAPPQPGIPPHWLNYVAVADLDAAFAKATALGATVCVPPMSIGEAGRIAVLRDPQGAGFGLHQAPKM